MVRALLDDSKTQTRRVFTAKNGGLWPRLNDLPGMHQILRNCPHGQPGDRLWVREAWRITKKHDKTPPRDIPERKCTVFFEAGGSIANQSNGLWQEDPAYSAIDAVGLAGKLRPGIFMPRWMSRINLEITTVRAERLRGISEADALAEGVTPEAVKAFARVDGVTRPAGFAYRELWESIHGPAPGPPTRGSGLFRLNA